jgi:hypothetical protein
MKKTPWRKNTPGCSAVNTRDLYKSSKTMASGVRKVCPCMDRRNIEVLRCQPLTPWLSQEMAMNPATCEPPELSLFI